MHSIAKTADNYNRIAHHFSATRRGAWPEFKELTAYLKNGQRILDWGCGNGRLFQALAGRGISYYGVDISRELLRHARRLNARAVRSGQAHFYCTIRRAKKFPDNWFDAVFMIASFFHLPDKASRERVLADIFRVTRPGGWLYISVWNLGSRWAKEKKRGWKSLGKGDWLIPWKSPEGKILTERYYHHFTTAELSKYVKSAGFVVKQMYYTSWAGRTDDKGGRNLIAVAVKL